MPEAGGQTYFDAVAPAWDTMRARFYSTAVRDRALALARIAAGQLAVDVGAGTGFMTEALLAAGLRVVAVDASSAMLDQLRRKASDSAPLQCHIGDAAALPLDDASADHAFATMYLHHAAEPAAAIAEMARVLRPGGVLTVVDLDAHEDTALRDVHHDRWMGFARSDVRQWFAAAGLHDIQVVDAGEECCAAGASDASEAPGLCDASDASDASVASDIGLGIFVACGTRRS